MVKEGSREENLLEVRDIINSRVEVGNNIYQVTDKAGNKLEADLNTGLIYRYKDNTRTLCNTVDTSKKENGYLYVSITIQTKSGRLKEKEYSQHGIIAMLAHTSDFDNLIADNNKVVPNHKNNIPWDNRPDNLEWTTDKWNCLHGKVVSSLFKNKFYVNNMTHRVWTGIAHNQSDKDFHVLIIPLSVDDIQIYEDYVGKALKNYWNLKDKYSTINEYKLVEFINWLDKNRHNKERDIRNYNMSKSIVLDDKPVIKETNKKLTEQEEIDLWFNN